MIEGKHTGIVIQHSLGKSSSEKQTPFCKVLFGIEGTDEKINAWIYFSKPSEAGMRMARKSLKAIGFDPDHQDVEILQTNPVLLAGQKAEIDIAEEEYPEGSGKYSFKVKWINSLSKPLQKKEMEELTRGLRSVKAEPEEDIPF